MALARLEKLDQQPNKPTSQTKVKRMATKFVQNAAASKTAPKMSWAEELLARDEDEVPGCGRRDGELDRLAAIELDDRPAPHGSDTVGDGRGDGGGVLRSRVVARHDDHVGPTCHGRAHRSALLRVAIAPAPKYARDAAAGHRTHRVEDAREGVRRMSIVDQDGNRVAGLVAALQSSGRRRRARKRLGSACQVEVEGVRDSEGEEQVVQIVGPDQPRPKGDVAGRGANDGVDPARVEVHAPGGDLGIVRRSAGPRAHPHARGSGSRREIGAKRIVDVQDHRRRAELREEAGLRFGIGGHRAVKSR